MVPTVERIVAELPNIQFIRLYRNIKNGSQIEDFETALPNGGTLEWDRSFVRNNHVYRLDYCKNTDSIREYYSDNWEQLDTLLQ